ncbi:class I SAM-dependent methyltransferase [Candidatus Woesearchaeota archaeon]|nr:class I SAM-dependent methyltransferase [Candidatus Woesearchaeota archaeon]
MFNFTKCSNYKNKGLYQEFKKTISSLEISNVFNPSFYIDEEIKVFSFRAIPRGSKELTSYLYINNNGNETIKNISDLSKEFDEVRFIDPKIFKIKNDLYITFNTGWYKKENNEIYVMKIFPKVEKPKKVLYKNRARLERNWAFFSENNETYALYSVNPLKILKQKSKKNPWEFEDYYCGTKTIKDELSIGTQLYEYNNKYYFVAHKKIKLFNKTNKKVYLGKLCEFDFQKKKIKINKSSLVHSYGSLLGDKIKHNTNLFSCTYFSGLQVRNNKLFLGYGINDVSFGFSSLRLKDFFKLKRSREAIFNEVYKKHLWGGPKTNYYSGRGSENFNTKKYVKFVQSFISKNKILTVVDLGCGDFRVGKTIDWGGVNYIGTDVSKDLITYNNKTFNKENIKFIKKDIVEERLPDGDLCLIRQVLQHLSNQDILKVLVKTKKYKYVIITDGLPIKEPKVKNVDKPTDRDNRWNPLFKSGLYLESSPFNLKSKIVLDYLSKNRKERFRTLLIKN